METREVGLDTEVKFDADVDIARHLHDFRELDRLLGGGLEVVNGEDLEAGFVDLYIVSPVLSCLFTRFS